MPKNIDPRLKQIPKTVNEIIADRAIRHALFLERYKTSVVNEIVEILNMTVEPKLISRVERSLRDIIKTSSALKALFKSNGELIKAEYRAMENHLYKNLNDFSITESRWQISTMKNAVPVTIDFVAPSSQILKALVANKPINGVLVKDWFDKLSADTAFRVNQQIQIGMVEGEGIEQIVRRIRGTRAAQYTDGILNISRHHLRSVVRTSVSHVSHAVREETYQQNSDVIKGIQILTALDHRVCVICMKEDSKVYPIGKGRRPAFHLACRCTTAPVLKSWKELGIDLKEAPVGTRATMNGQVATSVTYPQWLKKQSVEIQNEALGVSKAKLFRSGRIKIEQFVNQRGRPLRLDELYKLEEKLQKAG